MTDSGGLAHRSGCAGGEKWSGSADRTWSQCHQTGRWMHEEGGLAFAGASALGTVRWPSSNWGGGGRSRSGEGTTGRVWDMRPGRLRGVLVCSGAAGRVAEAPEMCFLTALQSGRPRPKCRPVRPLLGWQTRPSCCLFPWSLLCAPHPWCLTDAPRGLGEGPP